MKTSKVWLKICLIILMSSFLVISACSCKKKPLETQPAATTKEGISESEMEAKRKAEEAARLKKALAEKFVSDDIYFDFDKSDLRADARATLKDKVEWLNANPSQSVTIEGHCDERGTQAYNLALGERRAQSIQAFLVNAGINKSRLQTVSYGKEKPVDPGHNEAAWAKNRRGHFRID